MKIENEERLHPVDFALIKEYLLVGGNYKGISEVTGLPQAQIMEIDHSAYFQIYQDIQDKRVAENILDEAFADYEGDRAADPLESKDNV